LTIHVADHRINYYVDGQIFAEHGEPYYPETPMSVNFNQWFIADGLLRNPARRTYRLRVDYIYFAKDRVVPPDGVAAQIVDYRAASITHIDTL
jgi:beta-glucanase (GH16 family)